MHLISTQPVRRLRREKGTRMRPVFTGGYALVAAGTGIAAAAAVIAAAAVVSAATAAVAAAAEQNEDDDQNHPYVRAVVVAPHNFCSPHLSCSALSYARNIR